MKSHPNYEIFEELGRGTSTIVYRAYDRNLKRYVAIKTLLDSVAEIEGRMERFFRQAQFLASVNHPNVLRVYALEGEQGWIVMEQMAASMQDRLQAGPVSPKVAVSVLKQALDALEFIHGQVRIHGSIRPSNVLIDDTGMVKLSDFSGIGRDGGLEAPDPRLSRYVPPEVWDEQRFGPIGKQLDFYCLALTIIECLNGKSLDELIPGINRTSPPEIEWARWHTNQGHRQNIEKLIGDLPADLRPVLGSMLNQKSSDRPSSAEQIKSRIIAMPIVAVDFPQVSNSKDIASSSMPVADSPFSMESSPTRQSQPMADRMEKEFARQKFDLKNPTVFRLVAIATLTVAGLVGLGLQKVLKPEEARYLAIIEAFPPNASVFLKATDESKEELSGKNGVFEVRLVGGRHNVQIEADGFEPLETIIEVEPKSVGGDNAGARENTFAFKLTPKPVEVKPREDTAMVTIVTIPADVEVLIDGALETPISGKYEILLGIRRITLRKSGYVSKDILANVNRETASIPTEPLLPESQASNPPTVKETKKVYTSDYSGIGLVRLDSGEFLMGSKESELDRGEDEDLHEVTISKAFYLGVEEVTQSQFEKVMAFNDSDFDGSEASSLPVEKVSWFDAVQFCNKLSELDGLHPVYKISRTEYEGRSISDADVEWTGGNGFRLPTEAEWEYGCRAGTRTPLAFGVTITGQQANYDVTRPYGSDEIGEPKKQTVSNSLLEANAWGLKCMHGNVWEWCWDWYGPYDHTALTDPKGGSQNEMRVVRGGGWLDSGANCRSANRYQLAPNLQLNYVGFRVAKDVE